ncbi:MAG: flagellar basal-body rod protein FlgF [Alphaproteobacteria bacterium]|nr:flagellar basal-body rod protein FlgF [Alphaproteobacteria bacterium]
MENTAYILVSSQRALHRRLEVVSNNIANMNTPGYKADKAVFCDVLAKTQLGHREFYATIQGTYTDFREGAMIPTANQFDVALGHDGFLVVSTPQGTRYTRAGRLQLDADRQLVTSAGNLVQGQGATIVIPPGTAQILINKDGSITANEQNIDRLRVVRFEDNSMLKKTYGNMYVAAADPIEMEKPYVLQGMLEASNVRAIAEVTEMMTVLRGYQSVSRAVQKEDGRVRKMIEAYTRV